MHKPRKPRKPRTPTPRLPFDQRLTLDVTETAKALGLGRNTIYKMLKSGELKSVKFGSRNTITTDSIRSLLVDPGRWLRRSSPLQHEA